MAEEALTPEFLEFYQAYPRKEARRAALKAFQAAKKRGATQSEIMNGCRAYAAFVKASERRFIKLPATWLNGDCWADELVAPKPATHKPTTRPFRWEKTASGMTRIYEDA